MSDEQQNFSIKLYKDVLKMTYFSHHTPGEECML